MDDVTVRVSRRELVIAALVSTVLAGALLFDVLFLDRCTRAFTSDDPRIDLRPWARESSTPPAPINMISPDVDGFILPGLMRARQLASAGAAPWWDHAQLCGIPLAANIPFPLMYPVSWLLKFAAPMAAIDWMLFLHLAIAGALAYRACRLLGTEPAAAAVGAIGFALSSAMMVRWRGAHEVYAMSWWPAQLAAIEWLRRERWRRALIEGALATALMLLAGFPQTAVVLTAGTCLLAIGGRSVRRPRGYVVLGAMIMLGLMMAWPQLEISGRAFGLSIRASEVTREATAKRGLSPAALIVGVLPDFFGNPAAFSVAPNAATMEAWLPHRRYLGDDIQNSVYYNAFYPGMLLVVLLPALFTTARARRFAIGIVLALTGCIVSPLIMPHIPGMSRLATGNIKRLLTLVDACWPIGAAIALHAAWQRGAAVPWRTTLVLVIALAAVPALATRIDDPEAREFAAALVPQVARQIAFALGALVALHLSNCSWSHRNGSHRKWAHRKWARFLPALVLLLDLILLSRAYHPMAREQEHYPMTPGLAALAQRPGRIVAFGVGPNLVPPSIAGLFGIRSILGCAPMVPARTAELLACLEGPLFDARDPRVAQPLRHVASLSHPLLDLLGVDTIVHADPELASRTGLPVLFESAAERMGALARPSSGPRAFLCSGARVVTDAAQRLQLLADRAFDGHHTVLLEEPLPFPLPDRGDLRPVADVSLDDTRHQLVVDAPFAQVLVLTEAWDPGWRASIDGTAAHVFIADHALMAVAVPQGRHAIELQYTPVGVTSAVVIALAAAAAVLIVGVRGWRAPA